MKKVSSHFSYDEVKCRCGCGFMVVNPLLVRLLEKIRYNVGQLPVMVHSWCRCEKHNRAINGVDGSQHLYGAAADISIKGVLVNELASIAERCGADGIGIYKRGNFVHVDVRGYLERWEG